MNDAECVAFLQWALPQMRMRWPGFRKVRSQVCKRLSRRLQQLDLPDADDYRAYLTTHPQEWAELDALCRVTITRFYRDRQVFGRLSEDILVQLVNTARHKGREILRGWSIGCASGEEPWTLSILWQELFAEHFPSIRLEIVATEADPRLIERARQACYPYSAIKNLPEQLTLAAFDHRDEHYCLRTKYRGAVQFHQQDIRFDLPVGPFDLILCRNLVFTYFEEALQQQILQQLSDRLAPTGWLILGVHEQLPADHPGWVTVSERLGLYRKG